METIKIKKSFIIMDATANTGKDVINEYMENCADYSDAITFDTRQEAEKWFKENDVNPSVNWAVIVEIEL